jgi:hypothetical protein
MEARFGELFAFIEPIFKRSPLLYAEMLRRQVRKFAWHQSDERVVRTGIIESWICAFGIKSRNMIPDKTGAFIMERMDLCETSDAVSSMQTLRALLTEDLDDIENRIHELAQSPLASSDSAISEMQVYHVARAALYSGLAGINEVLGWVRMMAAKDSDGNIAEVVKSLPTVPIFSIH